MMKIRYANKKDTDWIKENLLKDREGRARLNAIGSDESNFIRLDDRWGASFIAEKQKEKLGFITVSYSSINNKSYLNDLYISDGHRKNGVGQKLLDFAMQYAFENWGGFGIYVLTLENKPMEELLEKNGFENCGTYNKCVMQGNRYVSQTYWYKEYEKN